MSHVFQHGFQIDEKGGCKLYDIFLITKWPKKNLRNLSMTLPLDFSESLKFFEITSHLQFPLIFEDVMSSNFKIINHDESAIQHYFWIFLPFWHPLSLPYLMWVTPYVTC